MNAVQDLCIVGGGIIGTAVAFYAVRKGLSTVLCEQGKLAGGASGLNPGVVALATKTPGDHVFMSMASMREFGWLADTLGDVFDYRQGGSLVIFEDDERDFAHDHAEKLRGAGVDITIVDAAGARRIQPILEGPILGALWSPRDLLVSAPKLARALARIAAQCGADIREDAEVKALSFDGETWRIDAGGGPVRARWLVNAAGIGASAIGRLAGTDHAISPRKGQLLATTRIEGQAPVRVTSVQELLRKQGRAVAERPGPSVDIGMTPQGDGSIFLGGTQEMVGLDASLDACTLSTISMRAARLYPRLGNAGIVRAWCGFRPATANGHPLVGTVAGLPRYVIAAGHGGDGVALSPITGRYVADLVAADGSMPAFGAYARDAATREQ